MCDDDNTKKSKSVRRGMGMWDSYIVYYYVIGFVVVFFLNFFIGPREAVFLSRSYVTVVHKLDYSVLPTHYIGAKNNHEIQFK